MFNKTSFAMALLGAALVNAQGKAAEKAGPIDQDFLDWAASNNKNYSDAQSFADHKKQWAQTKSQVASLNSNGKSKAKFAMNFTADMTEDEKKGMLGALALVDRRDLEAEEPRELAATWTSGGVNWSNSNMTAVKNQGQCGSCVAFAISSAMEGLISINRGTTAKRLSEQQMVDCARSYGNSGCSGGWHFNYANFLINEGATWYEDYRPYTATDGNCDAAPVRENISSRVQVGKNIEAIANAVSRSPLVIAMAAGNSAIYNYSSGIITAADGCPDNMVDHAVSIVGFGTKTETTGTSGTDGGWFSETTCRRATRRERRKKTCADGSDYGSRMCCQTTETYVEPTDGEVVTTETVDYWIVQNSWSQYWGDSGFFKLDAVEGNGICNMNSYVMEMFL